VTEPPSDRKEPATYKNDILIDLATDKNEQPRDKNRRPTKQASNKN